MGDSEGNRSAGAPAWLAPLGLALVCVLAYGPSLGGGFLGYDDDWLIETSPVMHDASGAALEAIVSDLGRPTRLVLGAEYLPVRDLVVWTSVRLVGFSAPGLRGIALGLYVLAVLAWHRWFARLLGPGVGAELAALAFALHPLHVESVAWLAGIKDVLALSFTGLALAVHAGEPSAKRRAVVTVLVLLACFSKAVSVVIPGLLLLHDLWARRPVDRPTLAIAGLVAVLAAAFHAGLGARIGMFATMPGGDRLSALATMGPVLVRYLLRVVLVEPASLVYDVPERAITDPTAMIALAGVAFVLALAAVAWRGGQRAPLLVVAWMLVALAPVSQVLAPLQNRMADRYLMVALAGPCLALGLLGPRLATPSARALAAVALVLALGTPTALRAVMFTQPIALWSEAAERAPRSPIPRYQLGVLLEARDPELAELAYRDAVARSAESTIGRRAAVNLGVLLARRGRLDEAADVLTRAHADAPDDPRAAHDLAVVLDARGEHDRARALLLDVMTRAPAYLPARRSYAQRFGAPPTPEPAAARYDVGDRQF